jgi:hypothetical protein
MPDSGWISFHMHTADDAQAVLALFRLNYERITAPRAVRQAD